MSKFEQNNSKAPGGDNEAILRQIATSVSATAASSSVTATAVSNISESTETTNNYNSTTSVDTTAISTVLGVTTGSAILQSADGTVQQYLRGLIALVSAGALMSKLEEMVMEQKKTNIYLGLLTNEEVRDTDVKE